jgi:hypothetical protein
MAAVKNVIMSVVLTMIRTMRRTVKAPAAAHLELPQQNLQGIHIEAELHHVRHTRRILHTPSCYARLDVKRSSTLLLFAGHEGTAN